MRIPLTLIAVMISLVLPSQSRAATTTYPQPLPPLTQFSTSVNLNVSVTGCQTASEDISYSTPSVSSYPIPLPLGGEPGQVGGLGGLPQYLADSTPFPTVTLPAPLSTILTLVNGVSEYQGSATPVVQTLQFSNPMGTQTRTYTLSVSGSVVKETLVSVYTFAGTDNSGYDQGNSKNNLASSYDISTGVQTFSWSATASDTNTENPNGPGCVTVQTTTQSGSGTASYYPNSPITIVPSLPPGMENVAYPSTPTVSGGVAPTVKITGLPTGLTADASGNITGTPAIGTAAKSPYSVVISASDSKGDSAGPVTLSLAITSSCPAAIVVPFAGGPISANGYPTTITASFSPTSNGNPITLAAAAAACGFAGFDWQQTIEHLPPPSDPSKCNFQESPIRCPASVSDPTTALTAPPAFSDPPKGGYTYELTFTYDPLRDAYPFYYNPAYISTTGCAIIDEDTGACSLLIVENDGDTLNFYDAPALPLLPEDGYVGFKTSLVGIPLSSTGLLAPVLFQWTWQSTYDGTVGGAAQTASFQGENSATGTGGVTITSVNGVTQTPPNATCAATPVIVWEPDDKSISLTVSGKITAGTSALASSTYLVSNEDKRFMRSGSITLGAGGAYSFSVLLKSWQKDHPDWDDHDRHDRKYTVDVNAKDAIGNLGTCSTTVTLPHDWDHKP